MSHARGQVKFFNRIKHFEFNGNEGICRPQLYDTYDEMINNWRKSDNSVKVNTLDYDKISWFKKIIKRYRNKSNDINKCCHNEESVEIFTEYGEGFYWSGTACRKCNMILKGTEPFEPLIERKYINGIPEWVENYTKYYD